MNRTSRAEVENAMVRASDLPAHGYSVEKILWNNDLYGVEYKAIDTRGRQILPRIVSASLKIETDADAARRWVDKDPLFGHAWKSKPVSLDSATAARGYQGPIVLSDGLPGVSACVLFSVNDVSGFVAVTGSASTVHIKQAEALAGRVTKRLAGKETSTRPVFFGEISQSDIEAMDAVTFAGKDLPERT